MIQKTDPRFETMQSIAQAIVFEDTRFIIINKPSGIAVHGGSGLSYGVIEALRALRPKAPYLELAHRIDRDTSGCLVIAKRRSALRAFQSLQTAGRVRKIYVTLLQGQWQGGKRKINAPLLKVTSQSGGRKVSVHPDGKHSISLFTPIQKYQQATLMRIKLLTGRTHQIRVHAQHSGHPIACDNKYGNASFNTKMQAIGLHRLYLHAESICLTLPDNKLYEVYIPTDPLMIKVLAGLDKI